MDKEKQFERIYKETENFGRTQFVREIQMQINDNKKKDKEIERLNNIINETRRLLGEYKHYSTPDEIQNKFNEEIVDKAYIKLHSNLELKEGKENEKTIQKD